MVVAVELLHQVARTVGIVRAVSDLAVAALEAAGKRDLRIRCDRVPCEGLGRLARAADPHVASGHEVGERVVGKNDDRVRRRDGEFLGCDRLERVAEDLGVVEPDVREEHDAGSKDVRRVVAAAEPGLDDGNVDARVRERRERGSRDDLELRRASRSATGRTRATATSKSASAPSMRTRSLQLAT